ncbi:MAG: M20/M25/M40 family metallo-hydrolase, partial [Sphingopyxis sp.]
MRIVTSLSAALCCVAAAIAAPSLAQDAPYQREARTILQRLVSFRSSEGHGQLNATADYIVGEAGAAGATEADIARIPVGETQAVLVRIVGSDPALAPVLLSAHFDVVDARPEDWEADPYALSEQGGFFIGRGAADNKAGVAALLST